MNSSNPNDNDTVFCETAKSRREIAIYLGISINTLNQWLANISIFENNSVPKGRLFLPKEVKAIIKECK